jgi:hypothetical protein
MYVNELRGVTGARWKWMAHETGHAFGLFDEDWRHERATLGSWSVMASCWSNQAIELGAWDRCLQGWLSHKAVRGFTLEDLAPGPVETKLSPLVVQEAPTLAANDPKLKAVFVVLNPALVLVVELRRNLGLDRLESDQEGVLAYTVDMRLPTMGGGYRLWPRPGAKDKKFSDGALRAGDRIDVDGVELECLRLETDGAVVRLGKGHKTSN